MKRGWLLRAMLRLVPRSWRETVAADLEEEARGTRRGTAWRLGQTMSVSARLRAATTVDAMIGDAKYAVRSLLRAKGFALAAVITFALGIGANVAVLSVIDRMMIRPLPYAEPDRLVQIHAMRLSGPVPHVSLPRNVTVAVARGSESFSGIAYASGGGDSLPGPDDVPLHLAYATFNLLEVLGVRPVAGRDFVREGNAAGRFEVLLTHEAWQGLFGGTEDFESLRWGPGARAYAVVGVLPPGFILPSSRFGSRLDGITALDDLQSGNQDGRRLTAAPVARLRPGVTAVQAQAEVQALQARLHAEDPAGTLPDLNIEVQPLQQGMFMFFLPYLRLITLAGLLVLLMAAGNLSTLLLVRGRSREGESAIRAALGASGYRMASAIVTEAAVLCLAGGATAILLCVLLQKTILNVVPELLRDFAVEPLDPRIVVMTLALAFVCAVMSGLPAAWRARRMDVMAAIQSSRQHASRRRLLGGSSALLAIEAALGVVLVSGAAATVRNFAGLAVRDPGFVAADLYLQNVGHRDEAAPGVRPSAAWFEGDRRPRVRGILGALRTLPDVATAGIFSRRPIDNWAVLDEADFWKARGLKGGIWGASDGALESLQTPAVAGRLFEPQDIDDRVRVAIVNRIGVAALWPGTSPSDAIARRLTIGTSHYSVIGVIRDIRRYPGERPMPSLFLPISSPDITVTQSGAITLLRMRPGVVPDRNEIRAVLERRFPRASLSRAEAVSSMVDPWFERPRFQAALFGSFAVIGLLLAAVGLYAVAAFNAGRRRREIGVRLTLGATTRHVSRMVVQSAVKPILVGAAAGLVVTWWAARFLQAFLFEVDARDPWTLALVVVVLGATAIVAAWLPARRAGRTDPADVLRST